MKAKLPKKLQERLDKCNGHWCECGAYGEFECGCFADWRSEDEVVMDWMRGHESTRHSVLDAYFLMRDGRSYYE